MSIIQSLTPRDRINRLLLAALIIALGVSCVALPYPKYFAMQHLPTALGVSALILVERRVGISRLSFALMVAFLLLHVLGARYLYSYVPYDDWAQWLFGVRLSDVFGFERNHYDRLVHLAFGILFVFPVWEFCEVRLRLRPAWSAVGAICMVLAASAVYEIMEWAVAMMFAPDWAESYNGQQGDIWDAQKDMALAWAGAVLAALFIAMRRKQRRVS